MNINKVLLVFFIVSLIIIASCDNGEKTRGRSADQLSEEFIGGEEGLVLSFVEGAPTDTVTSGDSFEVEVLLVNDGEGDASNVAVELEGIQGEDIGLQQHVLKVDRSIAGRDVAAENIKDEERVNFGDLSYKGQLVTNQDLKFQANVCYDYSTRFQTVLCVLQDPRDKDKTTVCKVGEDVPQKSSGAPVQITNIEERAISNDKTDFIFTVEHQGSGKIYAKGSGCDFGSVEGEEGIVYVSIGGDDPLPGLKCTGLTKDGSSETSGTLRFRDNTPKDIRCTVDTKDVTVDFLKPLTVSLTYGYKDSVQKDVLITKSE